MKVLKTHLGKEIEETIIFSDKSTSYIHIAKYVETHIMVKAKIETNKINFKMGSYCHK